MSVKDSVVTGMRVVPEVASFSALEAFQEPGEIVSVYVDEADVKVRVLTDSPSSVVCVVVWGWPSSDSVSETAELSEGLADTSVPPIVLEGPPVMVPFFDIKLVGNTSEAVDPVGSVVADGALVAMLVSPLAVVVDELSLDAASSLFVVVSVSLGLTSEEVSVTEEVSELGSPGYWESVDVSPGKAREEPVGIPYSLDPVSV